MYFSQDLTCVLWGSFGNALVALPRKRLEKSSEPVSRRTASDSWRLWLSPTSFHSIPWPEKTPWSGHYRASNWSARTRCSDDHAESSWHRFHVEREECCPDRCKWCASERKTVRFADILLDTRTRSRLGRYWIGLASAGHRSQNYVPPETLPSIDSSISTFLKYLKAVCRRGSQNVSRFSDAGSAHDCRGANASSATLLVKEMCSFCAWGATDHLTTSPATAEVSFRGTGGELTWVNAHVFIEHIEFFLEGGGNQREGIVLCWGSQHKPLWTGGGQTA